MPRVRKTPRGSSAAAAQVGDLCRRKSSRPPRRGSPRVSLKRVQQELSALERRFELDDWRDVTQQVFVALFVWMHGEVYGVDATEEVRGQWNAAGSAAGKMLRDEFDGSTDAMVGFVKWAWAREVAREDWRRKNGCSGSRLTWRQMYLQRSVLTDYRVDLARRKGAR